MSYIPEAPRNVLVCLPDGSEHACRVQYAGIADEGLHVWNVLASASLTIIPGAHLYCEFLPPKSELRLQARFTPEE